MSKQPIIIVKKRRHAGHGHHGGAWKVAYADFVTAMMAFFLVMWIVGQSKSVKAGVAGYFRDPGILEHERSTGILPGATTGINEDSVPQPPTPAQLDTAAETASLEKSAERLRELLKRLPEFEALKGQIEVRATSEGLRIELIDSSSSTFFDSASAKLKPMTERLLGVIAKELGSLGKPVVIEGHTDSHKYAGGGEAYSNWELSADRANAARRQMQRSGLPEELVTAVRGFADKTLAKPEAPTDPRNRRVSILVSPSYRPGPGPAGQD